MSISINKEQKLVMAFMENMKLGERCKNFNSPDLLQVFRQSMKAQAEIHELATKVAQKSNGVNMESVYKIYEDIAKDARTVYCLEPEDILEGIDRGVIQFKTLNIHEFLESYVLKEEENELFSNLFWYADVNTRLEYLEDKYLCDLDIYYTKSLKYFVLFDVNEEAVKALKNKEYAMQY